MKQSIRVLLCLVIVAGGVISLTGVEYGYAQKNEISDYSIVVNGEAMSSEDPLFLEDGRIFVPIRFVSETMDANIKWEQATRQLHLETTTGDKIVFTLNSKIMTFNGKEYIMDVAPFMQNDRLYLPLRHVSEFLHTSVYWDSENNEAFLTERPLYIVEADETLESISKELQISLDLLQVRNGITQVQEGQELKVVIPQALENELDQEELNLLARIIYVEAGYEPFEGQVAVGNVVMNRVESPRFPNSIREVIYQPGQFTPVRTGKFDSANPSETAFLAAREVLAGTEYAGDALYFYNPRVTNTSFFNSRQVVVDIGNHRFVR